MQNDRIQERVYFFRPYFPEKVKQQSFPLGIGYLASILEKEHYSVKIFDLNFINVRNKDVVQILNHDKPDYICVSCLTYDFLGMIELCRYIKENTFLNKIPVIIGGVHVSSLPEYSLIKTGADFAVIGEGENTIVNLLSTLKSGGDLKSVLGIAYFQEGRYLQTPPRPLIENLDSLPFPAWHLFNLSLYNQPHGGLMKAFPFFPIMATRGCPYQCTFCASKNFWRKKIRFRSVKNIVDEIEFLIKHYNAKEIQIWDDNFTLNRKFILEFAKEIINRKINIYFSCPNGVRIDTLDKFILRVMRSIGFYSLIFAVETASERIQKVIKKNLNLKIVPSIIEKAHHLGYYNRAFFIIGLPGETINDVYDTFRFALKLKLDSANFFIFTPLPGSEFEKVLNSIMSLQFPDEILVEIELN